jgi:hypothetical protein
MARQLGHVYAEGQYFEGHLINFSIFFLLKIMPKFQELFDPTTYIMDI